MILVLRVEEEGLEQISQRACVLCNTMKPVTNSNTVVVWDDAQWDKTLLQYMLTKPHTYIGIQFMFHALYIIFDAIHTIRIPYTSIQSCSSYLNPYTSYNSIQFHFIFHAIQFILSMQFLSFSYYYFILVYVVLFFWSLLSHISLSPIVLSITS